MKKPLIIIAFFALTNPGLSAQTQETILHARIWLDGKTMPDLENAGLDMRVYLFSGTFEANQFYT